MDTKDYLNSCKKGADLEKRAIKVLSNPKLQCAGMYSINKALKKKREQIDALLSDYEKFFEEAKKNEKEFKKMVKERLSRMK